MTKFVRNSLIATIFCTLLSMPCWAAPTPTDSLKLTVDKVMNILKAAEIKQSAKREKLSEIVRQSFDFDSMSQRILAQNWRRASSEERQKFQELLTGLLEQSYIGNLESYTNEKVEFVKERIKRDKAAIDTVILTQNKEIPVSYRMVLQGDDWKVYDVIVESVSFVNSYRSSYTRIIKQDGMAGLLAQMTEKLAELKE